MPKALVPDTSKPKKAIPEHTEAVECPRCQGRGAVVPKWVSEMEDHNGGLDWAVKIMSYGCTTCTERGWLAPEDFERILKDGPDKQKGTHVFR